MLPWFGKQEVVDVASWKTQRKRNFLGSCSLVPPRTVLKRVFGQWVASVDEFQIQVWKNTIWRRLRDAGLTYQKPEREYYEIDEAARKKWLRYEVPKIRRPVKKHREIRYFQDESC